MESNKKLGRLAGFIFLALAVTGMFAEFYVRQKLFVPNDPLGTAQNILENQWLFRLGFVSDLMMSTAFFGYTFVLFVIFKSFQKNTALFMLLCTVISVAMYCQNMLNQYSALEFLTNTDYSEVFSGEQLRMLSSYYFGIHNDGYYVNQIFFGLYLFPLGYMIYKSGLVPRIIGIFLMLGCIGDLIDFVRYFLFPEVQSVVLDNITVPADIGEISLCLWLIIMGAKNWTVSKAVV